MSRASIAEKLAKKRFDWIRRTALAFNISEESARRMLNTTRKQSVRINPLIGHGANTVNTLQKTGLISTPFVMMDYGFRVKKPLDLRDHPLVKSGAAYIQNAASWLPVLALDPKPGEKVLDLCAAPGGKTSHIAAITNNQAHIWANDNSRARLAKLQANCAKLGATIERLTLYDAERIARKLSGEQFDKILIDAPCSAEGLRNIENDKDVLGWSVAHIKRLSSLQKRIVRQAWQLLRPGGVTVYSTCTTAPEENEAVVDYLLRHEENAQVAPLQFTLDNSMSPVTSWNSKHYSPAMAGTLRLAPSPEIEAFYVCKFIKQEPIARGNAGWHHKDKK